MKKMLLIYCSILLIYSCKNEEKKIVINIPTVITNKVSIIDRFTVKCNGSITSDGGSPIQNSGICWGTRPNLTITDSTVQRITELYNDVIYFKYINYLKYNTKYYLRAFATNEKGTGYGCVDSFIIWMNSIGPDVKDIDGNIYKSVRIGDQIWMQSNLKVKHYRNDDKIDSLKYWAYNNNEQYVNVYGRLYGYFVMQDDRGVCPSGWHVPRFSAWDSLLNFLGKDVAKNLIEEGDYHWENNIADDSSGFKALPNGYKTSGEYFWDMGDASYFWILASQGAYTQVKLTQYQFQIIGGGGVDVEGYAIRCLKDSI